MASSPGCGPGSYAFESHSSLQVPIAHWIERNAANVEAVGPIPIRDTTIAVSMCNQFDDETNFMIAALMNKFRPGDIYRYYQFMSEFIYEFNYVFSPEKLKLAIDYLVRYESFVIDHRFRDSTMYMMLGEQGKIILEDNNYLG